MTSKRSFLLLQLGTPYAPTWIEVGRFLWRFLSDSRVIDLPWPIRFFLTGLVIIPLRLGRVVHAYASIWRKEGSPLRMYSESLVEKLRLAHPDYDIELAMVYDVGSIERSLRVLQSRNFAGVIEVVPLYPQYATSSTGAAFNRVYIAAQKLWDPPALSMISSFYEHPAYIQALYQSIAPFLNKKTELLVLSFHGVPIRHLQKSQCLGAQNCQKSDCPRQGYPALCYRAQCFATANQVRKLIGEHVPLEVVFQSRIGKLPWTEPNLTSQVSQWHLKGIRHITIACPSFTADCLETLEEVGIGLQETWRKLVPDGSMRIVPCLNDDDSWVESLGNIMLGAHYERPAAPSKKSSTASE